MKQTVFLIMILVSCAGTSWGQSSAAIGSSFLQSDCHFNGCSSFLQLVAAKDPDIQVADTVCFYDGKNPASKDRDTSTTDEFFLLMDGQKETMRNGLHPGLFVEFVHDGIPGFWVGRDPNRQHGGLTGLEDAEAIVKASGIGGSIYDDLEDSIRFAQFTAEIGKKMESRLWLYDETVIRKSTGRFVQEVMFFGSGSSITESLLAERAGKYKGQCFRTRAK
jgi:hypothetical protein